MEKSLDPVVASDDAAATSMALDVGSRLCSGG
jgi:hypothetical protein